MTHHHFHAALERARDRLKIARRNLDRGQGYLDPSDPTQARSLRKLEKDLESAQRDVANAQHQLDGARGALGLNL